MRLKGTEDGAWNLLGKEWKFIVCNGGTIPESMPERCKYIPAGAGGRWSMMDGS
jgi:hypothetical protein